MRTKQVFCSEMEFTLVAGEVGSKTKVYIKGVSGEYEIRLKRYDLLWQADGWVNGEGYTREYGGVRKTGSNALRSLFRKHPELRAVMHRLEGWAFLPDWSPTLIYEQNVITE